MCAFTPWPFRKCENSLGCWGALASHRFGGGRDFVPRSGSWALRGCGWPLLCLFRLRNTGLVPLESPLGRGVFSRPRELCDPAWAPAENPPGWGRSSGPRGDLFAQNAVAEALCFLPPNFAECGAPKSSARPGHPCDETAVAVLLGTPKLSPPPCFLAREISAPTAP